MSGDARGLVRLGIAPVDRDEFGEWLAGFVYGTIVVLSVLVAGARLYPHDAGKIAGLVAGTTLVFWLAHDYADATAFSVAHGKRLSVADLRSVARREWSIVEAGLPMIVALLVGQAGLYSTRIAIWSAFGLGLCVLAAHGVVLARVEHLSALRTLGVVAINLALGLVLIGLKLLVSH